MHHKLNIHFTKCGYFTVIISDPDWKRDLV